MGRDGESRTEAKAWRLFVAADIPEVARETLAEQLEPFRRSHPGLRWAPRENWHVTLKFLGAVRPGLVLDVKAGVADAAASVDRFDTRLTGADAFPNARRARVVWIGMSDTDGGFSTLARALDVALGKIVEPEERPFTPHLTVARAKEKQPLRAEEDLTALAALESAPFPVDRIVLYRSHLRRPAPLYEPVEEFPLAWKPGGR